MMVLQVHPHAGEVHDYGHTRFVEHALAAYARSLQNAWCAIRAARDHHHLSSLDDGVGVPARDANLGLEAWVRRDFNTTSSFVLVKQHADDFGLDEDMQVRMVAVLKFRV